MIDDAYGRRFFSMYDPDPKAHGVQEITKIEDLEKKNKNKFGIFWTVNEIERGKPRKKEFLKKINAIAFEVDTGTKDEQIKRIADHLYPSLIVETKRGYHSYFFVNDFEPDPDEYRNFILDRVAHFYNADINAADATRILRVPTFYHWKDSEDPFLIRVEHLNENTIYSKRQLQKYFPLKPKKEIEVRKNFESELKFQKDDNLFLRIYNRNQGDLLQKLSGTEATGMEKITFKRNSNGNHAILINNKSTSCWIDQKGTIGSTDGGGPTVWQWVNWYHKDHKKTHSLLKKYLPELFYED